MSACECACECVCVCVCGYMWHDIQVTLDDIKKLVFCVGQPTHFLPSFKNFFWVTGSARPVHVQAHYGKSGQVVWCVDMAGVLSVGSG